MDSIRTETRRGERYDPDDRTITPSVVRIDTMTENVLIASREKVNRDIAQFLLGKNLSQKEVDEVYSGKKLIHNDDLHYTEFIYGNPEGKHVVEVRPDNAAGSMGRVMTFRYVTPGPIQGPPKAA